MKLSGQRKSENENNGKGHEDLRRDRGREGVSERFSLLINEKKKKKNPR